MKSLIAIFVVIAWQTAAAQSDLSDSAKLFQRHFALSGGVEALNAVKSVCVTGVVESTGARFSLITKPPFMALLVISSASGEEIKQGRDPAGKCWVKDSKGVRDLERKDAFALETFRIAYSPPTVVWLADRMADTMCEEDTAEGYPVHAVGLKRMTRTYPRLLFDAASGRLLRIGHTRLFDFRQVEGLALPHLVKQGAAETFKVQSIRLNVDAPNAVFERSGHKGSGSLFADFPIGIGAKPQVTTNISPPGTIQIVRRTPPAFSAQWKMSRIPTVDTNSGKPAQFPAQGADLRKVNFNGRETDLVQADFDTRTLWPAVLPPCVDPGRVLELGKDPGLGVRKLHKRGITGRGIGIGTIDFPLLTEHREYADRLRCYEEVHGIQGGVAHMHGTAVASIAAGKTCGVAPEADLYHVSALNLRTDGSLRELDYEPIAAAIDRLLQINAILPVSSKIRVISISMGWSPENRGYQQVMAATQRASRDHVFVISTALSRTHGLRFDGLNRAAMADPNEFNSYGPGSWWASLFWNGDMRFKPGRRLCVPMDGRTTASPVGAEDFTHYSNAGWSWAVPWLAGLYALVCQVCPEITPERFWAESIASGKTIELVRNGERIPFGTIADPAAMIERLGSSFSHQGRE